MARPNNKAAIDKHVQGLRAAKAAFQALPEIVRDRMNDATEVTLHEIARHAKGHIQSSPSIRTRALLNSIAFSMNRKSGFGRVGVASARTRIGVLSLGKTVTVKGHIASSVRADGSVRSELVQPSRYAHLVEYGTSHSGSEPFMTPASEAQRAPHMQRRMHAGKLIERDMAKAGSRNL